MIQPARKYSATDNYRYGFNGQEITKELGGDYYEALFWEYDSRIVQRWNSDPVIDPNVSKYSVFNGNPIRYNDPKGDCPKCRDGKYTIQKNDNAWNLEKKWGLKHGSLEKYNPGINISKLDIGQVIKVSPGSTTSFDSPAQSITIQAGVGTTNASSFTFDEDFPYDPSAKATLKDHGNWIAWGAFVSFPKIRPFKIRDYTLT